MGGAPGGRGPSQGARGGAPEVQLGLWPGRQSRGRLLPSPHLWSAAGSCLLSGGPWLGLGFCYSWPLGVQPCPQVSPPPPAIPTALCAPFVCPSPLPCPGPPWWGWDAGRQDQAVLGPHEESHHKPSSPCPLLTTSQLPGSGAPSPASWSPQCWSEGIEKQEQGGLGGGVVAGAVLCEVG